MARAARWSVVRQCVAAVLAGGFLGGFLGLAFAQTTEGGWLDQDCASTCVGNGYEADFCGQVCWVQDPSKSAEADNLDWRCLERCSKEGNSTRSCLASCRRK